MNHRKRKVQCDEDEESDNLPEWATPLTRLSTVRQDGDDNSFSEAASDTEEEEEDELSRIQQRRVRRLQGRAPLENVDSFDAIIQSLRVDRDLYEKAQNTIIPAYNRWFRGVVNIRAMMERMGLVGDEVVEAFDRDFMDTVRHDEKNIEDFVQCCSISPARNLRDMDMNFASLLVVSKNLLHFLYHVQLGKQNVHAALEKVAAVGHLMSAVTSDGVLRHFQSVWEFKALSDMDIKDERFKLVLFLLQTFQRLGYRKKRDSEHIYTQVVHTTDDDRKICTRAYEPTLTICEAIHEIISKESRADLYQAILKQSVVKDVVAFLRRCVQGEFPILKVKDVMFSFLDGIYDCDTDTFVYYKDLDPSFLPDDFGTYKFFPRHSRRSISPPSASPTSCQPPIN